MEEKAQDLAEIRAIIFVIILDVESRRNMRKSYPSWSNGDEEGVSHSSSAQRVYSTKIQTLYRKIYFKQNIERFGCWTTE